MNFSFIDDPEWKKLDSGTQKKVIDQSFQKNIASDPQWGKLDSNTQKSAKNLYFQKANDHSKSLLSKPAGNEPISRNHFTGVQEKDDVLSNLIKMNPNIDRRVIDAGLTQYRENIASGMKPTGKPIKIKELETLGTNRLKKERDDKGFIGRSAGDIGKGLAHGALGLAESVGTGLEYIGNRVGSEPMAEAGNVAKKYWGDKAEKFIPSHEIHGKNVWDNPGVLKKAEFWLYNISDMVPALAASIVPGLGVTKAMQTVPALTKLAKLGGAVAGGLSGGTLEGTQTYNAVLEKGGTEEEAARAMELMTAGSGVLNALSVGKVLSKAGGDFKGRIVKHLGAGAWEGITEGLEEPTEVFSKYFGAYLAGEELPTDLKKQLIESAKSALTVAPIAALTGVGGSVLSGSDKKVNGASSDDSNTDNSGVPLGDGPGQGNPPKTKYHPSVENSVPDASPEHKEILSKVMAGVESEIVEEPSKRVDTTEEEPSQADAEQEPIPQILEVNGSQYIKQGGRWFDASGVETSYETIRKMVDDERIQDQREFDADREADKMERVGSGGLRVAPVRTQKGRVPESAETPQKEPATLEGKKPLVTSADMFAETLKGKYGKHFLVKATDEDLNKYVDMQSDSSTELLEQYEAIHGKEIPVLVKTNSKPGAVQGALIHKSTKKPGRWQLTYWDERGFSGDTNYETKARAINEAYKEGYKTPDPDKFKEVSASDGFFEGNRKVEEFHKQNDALMRGETPKTKKPASHKKGDEVSVNGADSILSNIKQVDGVDYELWKVKDPKDNRGHVRVFDADSGEVVSNTMYPDFDKAEAAFNKAVGIVSKPAEATQANEGQGITKAIEKKLTVNGKLPDIYKEYSFENRDDEYLPGQTNQEALRLLLKTEGFSNKEADQFFSENEKLFKETQKAMAPENNVEVLAQAPSAGKQSFNNLTADEQSTLDEAEAAGLVKKTEKNGKVQYQRTGDLKGWLDSKEATPANEGQGKKPWEMSAEEWKSERKLRRKKSIEKWNKEGNKGFPPSNGESIKKRIELAEQAGFELPKDAETVTNMGYHELSTRAAIKQGKIKSHPDYPDLGQAEAPKETKKAKASKIDQLQISDIHVDPDRFQYKRYMGKGGASSKLRELNQYNPELGGIISVWVDPKDGKTYVVNGHHRYELAKRTGYPELTVRYLDAESAEIAKFKGALINIAEGQGSPEDAAVVFRKNKLTPEELESSYGVSVKGTVAKQGMGLSRLDKFLFDKVESGDLPRAWGVIIGEKIEDHTAQKELVKMLERESKKRKTISTGLIEQLINDVSGVETKTEVQASLFGDVIKTRPLLMERAELRDYAIQTLSKDKRLFGVVGNEAKGKRLQTEGNVLNLKKNKEISERAGMAAEVINRLSSYKGPISDVLNKYAKELADAKKSEKPAVKRRFLKEVRDAVQPEITGRKGKDTERDRRYDNGGESNTGGVSEKQLEMFGPAPGQLNMFGEPPKQEKVKKTRRRKEKKVRKEAQIDLFTGKAKEIQRDLFKPFPKKTPILTKAPKTSRVKGLSPGIIMHTTGAISGNSTTVKNSAEVASLLAHIRKSAQEYLFAVTVDKDGKILEIHRYSKGTGVSSQVHPVEVAGHVLNIPNADTTYAVHNHPAGDNKPSDDDFTMMVVLGDILKLKGVSLKSLIIAGTEWRDFDGPKYTESVSTKIKPILRNVKMPVKERGLHPKRFVGGQFKNSDQLKAAFKNRYGNKEGFLYLDTQIRDIGFLPFPSGKPTNEIAARFVQEVERLNAYGFVVNMNKPLASTPGKLRFIQAITKNFKGKIHLMDIIEDGRSYRDSGLLPAVARGGGSFSKLHSSNVLYSIKNPQTKTKAFKKWFKGSKVVDENGEPLVVYHSTSSDVSQFDMVARGRSSVKHADNIQGVTWFARSKHGANFFAGDQYGANVMPVYLSLQNPLIVDAAKEPSIRDQYFKDNGKVVYDIADIKNRYIQEAKAAGNDSVIFKNGYDGTPASGDVYAVFDSIKIKSAIGNNGQFSENPDIRYTVKPGEPLTGMTQDYLKKIFHWADHIRTLKDGSLLITKGTRQIKVERVNHIAIDKAAFEIAYRRKPTQADVAAGAYQNGTITLSDIADIGTVAHESYHYLKDSGLINKRDVRAIHRAIGGKNITEEQEAEWIEKNINDRNQKGRLGKLLQKVRDIIDSFVNLFHRTARGVVRDIERGKFFDRDGKAVQTLVPAYQKIADKWYSQMEQALDKKLPGKGDPEQIAKMVQGWAGLNPDGTEKKKKGSVEYKADELSWSGLVEWLNDDGGIPARIKEHEKNVQMQRLVIKNASEQENAQRVIRNAEDQIEREQKILLGLKSPRKVTKAEVMAYLTENRLGVQEVVRADKEILPEDKVDIWASRTPTEWRRYLVSNNYLGEQEAFELSQEELHDFIGEEIEVGNILPEDEPSGTKFAQYQEPGGKNYRELLITLPVNTKTEKLELEQLNKKIDALEKENKKLFDEGKKNQHIKNEIEALMPRWNELMKYKGGKANIYDSPHWDEPNVLVHVRFNERTDADGARVLFIEEIQSDWVSDIRKKGAKGDKTEQEWKNFENEIRAEAKKNDADMAEVDKAISHLRKGALDTDTRPTAWAWSVLEKATNDKVDLNKFHDITDISDDGVPNAPWQKTYYLKVMQRMVRYAAENGFDSVGWTPGAVHAKRWGSEKIAWKKHEPLRLPSNVQEVETYDGKITKRLGDIKDKYIENDTLLWFPKNQVPDEFSGKRGVGGIENVFSGKMWKEMNAARKGWFVSVKEQVGGNADMDIEAEADARGLNTQNSELVATKSQLRKLIDQIAQRSRSEYSEANYEAMVDARTDKTWDAMQKQDEGVSLPRKESFESIYDKKIVNEVNKFFGKKAWGKARVGTVEIDTSEAVTTYDSDDNALNLPQAIKTTKAWQLPITPQMKSKALREGMPAYSLQDGKDSAKEKTMTQKGKGDIPTLNPDGTPEGGDAILFEEAKKYKDYREFIDSVPIKSRSEKRAAIREWKESTGYEQVDSSFKRGGEQDSIHSPSGPGSGAPLYDLTEDGVYPDDVYSYNGLRYYGTGEDKMDRAAYGIISDAEGLPNQQVKIYRAVEKRDPQKILRGDWVTTVRAYAKEHGEGTLHGEYKIVSKLVKAKDIFTSGDSWLEFGYHPQPDIPRKVYTKNRAKLINIWDEANSANPNPSSAPGKGAPKYSVKQKEQAYDGSLPETMIDRARETLRRPFNDAMYWIVDKNRPIATVQNHLKKVTDGINVFLKETQRPKITAARIQKAWDEEIKPLISKMAEYKINVQDLELYKHALHAREANKALRRSNAKMQVEKITRVLNDKEKTSAIKKQTAKIEKPEDWYNALNDIIAEYEHEEKLEGVLKSWKEFSNAPSGMSDTEAVETLKQYEGDKKIEELGGMLDSINDNKLTTLFNSGMISAEEYSAIASKYKHYVPLYREGFDDSMFGPSRGLRPGGRQIKVRGGSTRKVINILGHSIANYEKAINTAEKARSQRALLGLIDANPESDVISVSEVKKSPRHDQNGNLRMYPDLFNVNDNEMRLMVDGKQYLVSVQRDNKDAMLMLRTLKAEDGMSGPIVNTLAKLNRFLAKINTTWSPEFIVSNFVRDIQTAGINIQDTGVKGKSMLKGAKDAWGAIFAIERGKAKGTELEGYYERFKAAGGKIGWADVHGSVENLSRKITAEIEMQSGKRPVRKRLTDWMNLIEDMNTSIENGIRLHVFKLAVDQGKTDERAAQIASDLTVDFTKKGAAGPVINSLYLFANAGIQGSYRIMRAATKSRAVQKTLVGIIGAGFLVGLLNSMAGGEDEDGEDYYNKLDDFIRERNAIFMIPGTKGKSVKIPLPWGYNLFWNIGAEASRAFTKENYDMLSGAGRLVSVFANAFNPVASGTLLQTLSPTVSDPFVQVAENKNWFGGDLMPTINKFDKTPTPDSQRYWKSASIGSKWITEQLNDITGGDKIKPGMIDVSPETLDLVVDTVGGSALRFVKDSLGLPFKAIRGEEIEMHKIPFIRRVAGASPEWANSRIFYQNIEDVFVVKEQLKAYRGTPSYRKLVIATKNDRRMIPLAEASEKRLRALRKRLKVARTRSDKKRIEQIQQLMNKVYIRFNKKYNETRGD